MLKLNTWFRSRAFLFLTSICITLQTICNRDSYLERVNDVASVPWLRQPNSTIRCPETTAQERHANLTSAARIQRFNDALDISGLGDNCTCEDSSVSTFEGLLSAFHGTPEKTLIGDVIVRASAPKGWAYTPGREGLAFGYVRRRASSREKLQESGEKRRESGGRTGRRNRSRKTSSGDSLQLKKNVTETNQFTKTRSGLSDGAIVGITLGVVAVVLFLARCLYSGVCKKKKAETHSELLKNAQVQLMPAQGIIVRKAIEFSYEELSKATNGFSVDNKIGQGGCGDVFYAELRGEKAAIKKMDMRASKEFLAELKVLTHVHHLNLVRLIGYCVEGSLFLVYEYIDNGNLCNHLHGSEREPLPWSTRVQIALNSARGLEYIHEYTLSVFIHCDIKSANILIDNNLNAKVADLGLTNLTGVGSTSRLGGTFGYMPPEYVQYGEVSPKVDVYAFGVVVYELISAKKAIIGPNDSASEPKGLVALFNEVLIKEDPQDGLAKLVDPRLGDNYSLDSMHKMAQLAKACTHEDPQQRPRMRSIVAELMTLLSSIEDDDVSSFYESCEST